MERRLLGCDADDGVGAALTHWPAHLPDVYPGPVALLPTDTVRRLSNRVSKHIEQIYTEASKEYFTYKNYFQLLTISYSYTYLENQLIDSSREKEHFMSK